MLTDLVGISAALLMPFSERRFSMLLSLLAAVSSSLAVLGAMAFYSRLGKLIERRKTKEMPSEQVLPYLPM